MTKRNAKLAAVLGLALAGSLSLAACEQEGPAEQLGEAVDESAEEVGDAVEDATN